MTSPSTATDVLEGQVHSERLREASRNPAVRASLETVLSRGAAHADFFAERVVHFVHEAAIRVDRGRPGPLSFRVRELPAEGFSVRGFRGARHALVWSNSLSDRSIKDAGNVVSRLIDGEGEAVVQIDPAVSGERVRTESTRWGDFLVERMLDAALSAEPSIAEIRIRQTGRRGLACLVTPDGAVRELDRSYAALRVDVQIETNEGVALGYALSDPTPADPEFAARVAVDAARDHRSAVSPVIGRATVVFASGCGTWLHEAAGHALEADVAARVNGFGIGDRLGPDWLNVTDGSSPGVAALIDDEGTRVKQTRLIVDGTIQAHLVDLFHARHPGTTPTGNGRRASFRDLPLPRINHLCVEAGTKTENDLIREAGDGLVVSAVREACLEPDHDRLKLVVERGRRIRGGSLAEPVRDVAIIASPRDLLAALRAVGVRDTDTDTAVHGVCHKRGQLLPVYVDAPYALFEPLRVVAL